MTVPTYRILSLAILLATCGPRLGACPPSFVDDLSLWAGTWNADRIVTADIVKIDVDEVAHAVDWLGYKVSSFADDFGVDLSLPEITPAAAITLDVTSTLKGKPRRKIVFRLEGIFSEDLSYIPSPGIFFLHRRNGVWRLTRHAIFYRSQQELDDLRRMIRKAMTTAPAPDPWQAPSDWLAEAVARPGSRRHVLRHLPASITRSPAAMRRIAEGFVAHPVTDESFPQMLALLSSYPSLAVDRAAAAALDAMRLEDVSPTSLSHAEVLVEQRLGSAPRELPQPPPWDPEDDV